MKTLFAAILLSTVPAMATDIYTFTVPNGVTVSTPAGLETGWGYAIQNQSSTDWLVTTNLGAGTFLHATPQTIFDFPALAPGASVTVPYNPVPPAAGLYQILWDQHVPAGLVNSGVFTLSAQWWSGDPTSGGSLIGLAPDASQPYSASLTPVPEPGSGGVVAWSLLLLGVTGIVRRQVRSSARG